MADYGKNVASEIIHTRLEVFMKTALEEALKEKGWSKAEFLRRAAKELLGVETEKEGE